MVKHLAQKIMKTQGRINRTYFLAYSFVYGAAALTLSIVADLLPGPLSVSINILVWLFFAAILISLAIKRVHDFDEGAWFALLLIVPLANLYLVFEPGSPIPNKYGAVPQESSLGIKILAVLAVIWPVLVLPLIVFFPSVRHLFESL